jgi:hypothetical protein
MKRASILLLLALVWAAALAPVAAQTDSPADPVWQPIEGQGVLRASALVDSVYVDKLLPSARVEGGDFAAYLMARLGLRPFPEQFGFRVQVDTARIRIGGTLADLPAEARRALSQALLLLPPETELEALVELHGAGREAVRFHLASALLNGIPVPETFLSPLLAGVGRQYPALTSTGRDLLVQVPAGASMRLEPGSVLLLGP